MLATIALSVLGQSNLTTEESFRALVNFQNEASNNEKIINLIIQNKSPSEVRFNVDFSKAKMYGCEIKYAENHEDNTIFAKDSYGKIPPKGWAHRSFVVTTDKNIDSCGYEFPIKIISENGGRDKTIFAAKEWPSVDTAHSLPGAKHLHADLVLERGMAISTGYIARLLLTNSGPDEYVIEESSFNFFCKNNENKNLTITADTTNAAIIKTSNWVVLTARSPQRPSVELKSCQGEAHIRLRNNADTQPSIDETIKFLSVLLERHFVMGKI